MPAVTTTSARRPSNPDLRSLLLSPTRLRRLQTAATKLVRLSVHERAWANHWQGLQDKEEELQREIVAELEASASNKPLVDLLHLLKEDLKGVDHNQEGVVDRLSKWEIEAWQELREILTQGEPGAIVAFGESQVNHAKRDYVDESSSSSAIGARNCLLCPLELPSEREHHFLCDRCEERDRERVANKVKDLLYHTRVRMDALRCRALEAEGRRPSELALALASHLARVYDGQVEREELMKEAFGEVASAWGERKINYRSVKSWTSEAAHLRSAHRACIQDFKRSLAALVRQGKATLAKEREEEAKKRELEKRRQIQDGQCIKLRLEVEKLRDVKREEDEARWLERERKEAEERRKGEMLREKEERERSQAKMLIRQKRGREAEEEAARRRMLELDLAERTRERRETALRDRIRVNFRRVASAKRRQEEQHRAESRKMDDLAREARLESLRRAARKRMGIDGKKSNGDDEGSSSATANTEAVENRLRERIEDRRNKNEMSKFRFAELSGYSDDAILSDPRLALEAAMREAGMLRSGRDALAYGLSLLEPPTKPRPDAASQIIIGGD